jgi:asparagine synthetase B (glutamine-hydrolysing)
MHDRRITFASEIKALLKDPNQRPSVDEEGPITIVPRLAFACKLAHDKGVVMAHVGEGGDELFCGHPHWGEQVKLQRMYAWPVPRHVKQLGLLGMRLLGNTESKGL